MQAGIPASGLLADVLHKAVSSAADGPDSIAIEIAASNRTARNRARFADVVIANPVDAPSPRFYFDDQERTAEFHLVVILSQPLRIGLNNLLFGWIAWMQCH